MTFEAFYKYYLGQSVNSFDDDGREIKGSTLKTKDTIYRTHLLLYFGEMVMQDIQKEDIRKWRNMMKHKKNKKNEQHSYEYINACHNQISALFNFGMRNCGLTKTT